MKSITVHNIDEQLDRLIKSRAESEGLSVNKMIKKLLEESLGVKPQSTGKNLEAFKEFSGLWSDAEVREFEKKTKDLRGVDDGDWQ